MSHFIDIAEHGGHWCRLCRQYVTPVESDTGRGRTCPKCKVPDLRWDPPVPGFKRNEALLQTDPRHCHV